MNRHGLDYERITLSIESEQAQELRTYAKEHDLNLSQVVREALRGYFRAAFFLRDAHTVGRKITDKQTEQAQ